MYVGRGDAWLNKKAHGKAISDYNEALRIYPSSALVYLRRGIAWHSEKEYEKAHSDYREAQRLEPKNEYVYNGQAWLWATCPDPKYRDGKRAVESAKMALELNKNEAIFLDTLGAAYAEVGLFEEAIRCQQRALKDLDFQREYGDKARQRLELYRNKMPYREG